MATVTERVPVLMTPQEKKRLFAKVYPITPVPFWFNRHSHFHLFELTIFIASSVLFTIPTI